MHIQKEKRGDENGISRKNNPMSYVRNGPLRLGEHAVKAQRGKWAASLNVSLTQTGEGRCSRKGSIYFNGAMHEFPRTSRTFDFNAGPCNWQSLYHQIYKLMEQAEVPTMIAKRLASRLVEQIKE